MTAAARIRAVPAPRPGELLADGVLFAGEVLLDAQSAALASRIDAGFLAEAGWDATAWVLTLPAEHPLLGRTFCRAPGCQTTCAAATRVCLDCQRRLAAAGLDLEDVALLPPPHGKRWLGAGDGTCKVSRCPRPWVTSRQPLCPEHLSQRERLGVRIADFTARADVIALPSMAPARWHHARGRSPGTMPSTATRTCSGCASCAAPAITPTRRPGG